MRDGVDPIERRSGGGGNHNHNRLCRGKSTFNKRGRYLKDLNTAWLNYINAS